MKSWTVYALHIVDSIDKIDRIRERGNICEDPILYDATLRNLQTLSEATQRLPDELKNRFDSVPWRSISGFRNILVHNYLGDIDSEAVHRVVQIELPELKAVILEMLAAP